MRIKHFLPAVLALVLFTAAQFAQAASLPEFSELAAKCGPAVVNISAERTSPAAAGPEEFFGEMFRGMPPGADRFFEFSAVPMRAESVLRKNRCRVVPVSSSRLTVIS